MNKSKEYEEFKQVCQSRGWKCTPQRYAVYRFMKDNLSHPTVDAVWDAVRKTTPTITRESVFRILTELSDSGLIYRMDKIVSARFDGRMDNHGHLICEKCGKVIDFELEPLLTDIRHNMGFQANHTEIRVSGICEECVAKGKQGDN